MKAMILAAGKGERMRPLTDTVPKPLLDIAGKPMLQHHVEALVKAGIRDLVINHSYLGSMIEERFADGSDFGARIEYSAEGPEPLETGGGIYQALPLLGEGPFIVVNGDIWCDYPYADLQLGESLLAHIVLVPNPSHNPAGDFGLEQGRALNQSATRHTFAGIGVYRPALFAQVVDSRFPLAPLLREAANKQQLGAELYPGSWLDVGTVERLNLANSIANGVSK